MKNPYQQKLKRSAKAFHKKRRGYRFSNGLIVWHLYDNVNMSKLSWWDDVGFILNDYLVQVAWVHPRMVFSDQLESEAHKRVQHLDINVDDFLNRSEPNYVKIGKSRKKLIGYKVTSSMLSNDWKQAYDIALAEVQQEADFKIKPFIKTEWTSHGRFVEICAPIEVRNEQDLLFLAKLVKKLLKNETSLDQAFLDYVYTRDDWAAENETVSHLCLAR